MIRGTTKFICTQCFHEFTGPDIEYMATVLTQPLRCLHCGSHRTRPGSKLGYALLGKAKNMRYEKVWEEMEKL